jgi:hypothetical protein
VQERLGHSGIGITLDTYSHVLPGMQEQAAQALETKLFGKSNFAEKAGDKRDDASKSDCALRRAVPR